MSDERSESDDPSWRNPQNSELGYKREALLGLREEIPGLLGKLEYGAKTTPPPPYTIAV